MRTTIPLPPRDVIVVLGCPPTADGQLTEAAAERVSVAADAYRRHAAPLVCLTGGARRRGETTEAAAMAEAICTLGVPTSALVLEPAARTTAENARLVAALFPGASAWIVTQPFHARRAVWLFRRAGMQVSAWSFESDVERRRWLRTWRWRAREVAAWCKVAWVAWRTESS